MTDDDGHDADCRCMGCRRALLITNPPRPARTPARERFALAGGHGSRVQNYEIWAAMCDTIDRLERELRQCHQALTGEDDTGT